MSDDPKAKGGGDPRDAGSDRRGDRERLQRFRTILESEIELRRVFPAAIDEIRELLGFDEAALLVLDQPRHSLRLFATSIPIPDRVEIPLHDAGTASARAIADGDILRVDDTSSARFAYDRRLHELGFLSHVALPLRRSARVVGTLNLAYRRRGGGAELDRQSLEEVSSTLAIALDNALLFERLRSSESRYSSLVEGAQEFIYRLDPEARLVFANQAGALLLGRPVEDMVGRMWSELIHPGDARPDLLSELLAGRRQELVLEVALYGPGGASVPTRHRIHTLRDASGALLGLQGVAHDLGSERRADRAIQLHQELVEALDDYVFMADTSGRLLAINRKARETLGWNLDEVAGMTIWDLHPPEEKARLERERWRIAEAGVASFEVRLLARSGRTIPTRGRVTYSPASGTFQGVYRDTTGEQQVQERLLQVERLRALGELASGVAHTFNNLLAIIGTTVQVARRLTKEPPVVTELEAIQRAVFDGGAAVRRIQDFSRKRPLELHEDLDLAELLREVAGVARNQARTRAATPGFDIRTDLGPLPLVRGSEPALKDAFLNLLFNAMDAQPAGGPIAVRARALEGRVRVEIEDQGRGMTPEVRSRIFTPFFSTKGEGGLGLGLAIALDIVAQHGGAIEVDSRPGAGTTVAVTLPPALATDRPRERAARVLLVVPEPLLRTRLERAVSGRGHHTEVAASAAGAREAMARSAFDVVFADFELDGESGLDVADRARAGGARVVLLTGWGDEISPETVRTHRLDALLRKPFPAEAVLNLVQGLRGDASP